MGPTAGLESRTIPSYSGKFRNALENDRDGWFTSRGYMGQFESLASNGMDKISTPNHDHTRINQLEWARHGVFGPEVCNDMADKRMNDAPLPWATEKDLIVSAAMLTEDVVLTHYTDFWHPLYSYQYYNASPRNSNVPSQVNFTPLFFSHNGSESTIAPDLLSAGDFDLTYQQEQHWQSERSFSHILSGSIGSNVKVIDASATSSAALGGLSSVYATEDAEYKDWHVGKILPNWFTAYGLADYAPAMTSAGNSLEFVTTLPGKGLSDGARELEAQSGIIRVADGGYVDNTTAAYLMKHMQNNRNRLLSDGSDYMQNFHMVLFVNNTSPLTRIGNQNIPTDLCKIFGVPTIDPATEVGAAGAPGASAPSMSSWVFDKKAWDSVSAPDWRYSGTMETNLRYYKLNVTTVQNRSFGVEAGNHGVVHIFIGDNLNSGPSPSNHDDYVTYQGVYNATRQGRAQGGGWAHLKEALGLN